MRAVPDAEAVLALVGGYLATDMGRAHLAAVAFQQDRDLLEHWHSRLADAMRWVGEGGGFSFVDLADPGRWLATARVPHAALGGGELLEMANFLDRAAALRQAVVGGTDESNDVFRETSSASWPRLVEMAMGMGDWPDLRRQLRRSLLPSGELADDASPELARLRRQRQRQRQALESALASHVRRLGGEGALQESVITVRGDRYVLPVKTEQRRRAPGIVHGASSTGQTLFVEPLETVELNNENIRLADAEQAEIYRILAELTAAVGAVADEIASTAEICGALEWEAAKARFASDYKARPAVFTGGDAPQTASALALGMELIGARHPLLVATLRSQPGKSVVPLNLRLERQRVLVISGPNTGGKTVVLKTVAMAAWMAQCGLPVCAAEAQLPIFDAIHADVGDVQSIQQSLSTFSSHLVHVRDILVEAGDRSLVLLDELGTATNAAEGAALAVEIADRLRTSGVWTLITTHHDGLKAWAAEHPDDVANGSVAVDAETLAPSYQFRLGVPGVSAGLDMAARLGLPSELIGRARQRLSQGEREAGEYLQRLQRALAESEARLNALQAREQAVEMRERELEQHDRAARKKQLEALRAETDRRLAALAARADQRVRQAIEEVEAGLKVTLTAAQRRKLALAGAHERQAAETEFRTTLGLGEAPRPGPQREPKPGDRVRLNQTKQPVRILRKLADGGFEVQAGVARMRVALADVAEVLAAEGASAGAGSLDHHAPVSLELNLIGLRREEALDQLDRFLDRALRAEAAEVRIVHGTGFGVLRQAVAEALREHPAVAQFAHPPHNQGGQGVTIAELK